MQLSNDTDILRMEPAAFEDHYIRSQVLAQGTGATLTGGTLTVSGVDFNTCGVKAGHVIVIEDTVNDRKASYEICSMDSATQLALSILRNDDECPLIDPADGTNLDWRIATFDPQAALARDFVTRAFGLRPGTPDSAYDVEDVENIDALRDASAAWVLSRVFATQVPCPLDDETEAYYLHKFKFHTMQYHFACRSTRLVIDTGGPEGEHYIDGAAPRVMRV